jgi:proline racemase
MISQGDFDVSQANLDGLCADASFTTVDTHTAGEPTRILLDGIDRSTLADGSVRAKRDSFADEYDQVRELLMQEPRGHADMFGAVVVEPQADADVGVFFMDAGGYLDMCGHGVIGVVSALVELGCVSAEPTVRVATPAGVVETTPHYTGDGVDRVTIRNVESFVYETTTVPVSFLTSPLQVDVAYAGNFLALVDSEQLGVWIGDARTADLVDWALEIRTAVNDTLDVVDPFSGAPTEVSITEIYESGSDVDRNIVVFGDGQVDRSPCGTGTCAKMALLYELGRLGIDEPYVHESVVGTRFEGRIVDIEERGDDTVIVPAITGAARITGTHTFVKDSRDPITSVRL